MQSPASPHIVRAHHTYGLWKMEYLGYTPEQVTASTVALIQSSREGYAHDVLGTAPAESSLAIQGVTRFFQTFQGLSPDHPVLFSALDKDGICKSCVIGAHCDVFYPALQGDAEWLKGLRATAQALGLTSAIEVVEAPMLSTWLKRPVLRAVSTNAETARRLLSDPQFPIRTATSPLDYLKKRAIVWADEVLRDRQAG